MLKKAKPNAIEPLRFEPVEKRRFSHIAPMQAPLRPSATSSR